MEQFAERLRRPESGKDERPNSGRFREIYTSGMISARRNRIALFAVCGKTEFSVDRAASPPASQQATIFGSVRGDVSHRLSKIVVAEPLGSARDGEHCDMAVP